MKQGMLGFYMVKEIMMWYKIYTQGKMSHVLDSFVVVNVVVVFGLFVRLFHFNIPMTQAI